jgi:hypothetical protein
MSQDLLTPKDLPRPDPMTVLKREAGTRRTSRMFINPADVRSAE